MEKFTIKIEPQYVKLTDEKEIFPNGRECFLHEVQKRMKLDFEMFPEFTIITAPTGTGKSYAFPFPIVNSKKNPKPFDKGRIRGLIVLPTNALIDELKESFSKTYPFLNIKKITGKTLDEFAVKGFDRWEKVMELCKGDTDLIITNPDIINYAMHGGYHQNTWRNTKRAGFQNFLEGFGYIVFDEYHLYDESQIANILTLVYLRDIYLNNNNLIKFFFVSATPEKALKEILINRNCNVEEIIEEIVDDPHNSRAIHGTINVDFCSASNISLLVHEYNPEISKVLELKKRVLIILDRLNEVQMLAKKLASCFPSHSIYQSTGYISKEESHQILIEKADIIISTNKAEVGVNYNVEFCIMQPGRYYQNFVQRFGRVSRGNVDGKVVICFDNVKYNSLKRAFRDSISLNYYQYIDIIRSETQLKRFYSERVPYYQGEYIWCIENNLRDQNDTYNTFHYFRGRLSEENFFKNIEAYHRYKLFSEIDKSINALKVTFPQGTTSKAWSDWWRNYQDTFLCFRDSSIVVQIIDRALNIELSYSLEWILQYKEILNIEEIQYEKYCIRKYTVGDLKERDKDIQYQTNTIPSVGLKGNDFLSIKEMNELSKVFEERVIAILEKQKKGTDTINRLQIELLNKVILLGKTFDRKRLKITDIISDNQFI
ncbi:MAG: type I-D CRISPR-associated helicase Cas3' [Bacteroidales bacterium]|nr:type I-D CRISPR-associated helicase Cas3' [Bacteroidales bacterium]